ncbi:MAG: hypothetical protein ACM3XN_09830 [Chloroflexota bacterium]
MTLADSGLRRQFLSGLIVGVILTLSLLAGGATVITRRGVSVSVDIEPVALMVREQVTAEAQRSLPQFVSEMEARVPEMVATEMAQRMRAAASFSMADFTFDLPDSVTAMIQERLQAIVEDIIYECFAMFDTDLAAAQLGDQAYELVKTSIASEASELALQYRLFGRLPLPVTLNFR